ncbi:hypothetical protein Ddc_13764 [Ditylenchus destructor]|nr:hypothetical protein Ddc_13764 [Ditylenchus destructor]
MHPKPECSKCGQRDFVSLGNLETHIVAQHFRDVFYECLYPKCQLRFLTTEACFRHELDVHLNGELASLTLKQMVQNEVQDPMALFKRRNFVEKRLAIHDCLNQSINVTGIFSVPDVPNVNNFESLTTTDDDGKKRINTQNKTSSSSTNNPDFINESIEAVIESVARSKKAISSVSQLNKLPNVHQPCSSSTETITKNLPPPENKKRVGKPDTAPSSNAKYASKYSSNGVHTTPSTKRSMLMANAEGLSNVMIAKIFGISEKKVQSMLRKWKTECTGEEILATPECQAPAPEKKKKPVTSSSVVHINIDNLFRSEDVTSSIARNNEKTQPEISGPFLVKDEPSSCDELAETIPVSSNHSDKLTVGNIETSAPKPRMEILSEQNNELKNTEHENSVVKDEPSFMEELTSTFPGPSNHNGLLIPLNTESAALSLPSKRSKMETVSASLDENNKRTDCEKSFVVKDEPSTQLQTSSSLVVKDEPSLIDELAAMIPAPSNYDNGWTSLPTKKSRMETVSVLNEENNRRNECGNSSKLFIVKDEPNDGLTAPIPAPPQKPKRSRKQDFADIDPEDIKRTQPQISSKPSVFKDEPSLIDELVADIPGPSSHDDNLTPSNNDLPPPETKQRQKQKYITPSVRHAVVMANAEGLPNVKIARIFDISQPTVSCILKRWRDRRHCGEEVEGGTKKRGRRDPDIHRQNCQRDARVSKRRKQRLENSGMNGEQNKMIERENVERLCAGKAGSRLVNVLVTDPALSRNDSVDKNNGTIEPETSSKPSVIKEEPSLMDELTSTIPASPNHPHSYKEQANSGSVNSLKFNENLISSEMIKHANSVVKDEPNLIINQNTEPEISSSLFVIKEEPSLFDELAETFPAASNRLNESESDGKTEGTVEKKLAPKKVDDAIEQFIVKEDSFKSPMAASLKILLESSARTESLSASRSMQRKPACACQSTQRKLACSQCGQRDFSNLDDLEAHIVEQHFSNVDGYYECLYPKCSLLFPTELVYLKHEFDVHLKGNLASNQMKERCFVIQRLKIHNLLNESINFSFSDHPGSNGNNIQHPTTTTHVPVMRPILLLKKRAYNIQNEPSRNERLETTAHRGQAQPSSEREQQTFYNTNDAGMKRTKAQSPSNLAINLDRLFESEDVTRSTTADASVSKLRQSGMDNSGPNDKNKETERENSSRLYVVKDEPSDELTQNIPSSSNRSSLNHFLKLGIIEPVRKNNERIKPETSSRLSVVKDEPSLIDELAETIPINSDHSDYLSHGNVGPSTPHSMPEATRVKILSDQNNERTQHENNFVVKDEPCLIEEMDDLIPCHSNDNDPLTSSNTGNIPDSEDGQIMSGHRKGRRSTLTFDKEIHTTKPWLKSKEFRQFFDIILENGQETANVICKVADCASVISRTGNLRYHIEQVHNVVSCTDLIEAMIASFVKFIVSTDQSMSVVENPTFLSFLESFRKLVENNFENGIQKTAKDLIPSRATMDIRILHPYSSSTETITNNLPPSEAKPQPNTKQTTPSVRRAIVMASAEGLRNVMIAKIFDLNEKTVRNILSKWKTEGTVEKNPRKVQPAKKIDDAIEQFILKIIKDDPFKSALAIKSEVFKKFNKSISYRTARTVIKRYDTFRVKFQRELDTS